MWQAVPVRCLANHDYIIRIEYIMEENVTPAVIWATTPAGGGGDDEKSNTIWNGAEADYSTRTCMTTND